MILQSPKSVSREQSNEALNLLMRAELAAVETYRQALATMPGGNSLELNRCLTSHDLRAVRLAEHVTLAGGTPLTGNGTWESFTRVMTVDSAMVVRTTLLAALEEGESQTLGIYRASIDQVDGAGVTLIRNDLLPEQVRTLGIVNQLYRRSAS